jgi:hypothetical protein
LILSGSPGSKGFVTISALQKSKCCNVPDVPGVYLVLRASKTSPEFLAESSGGHFKGNFSPPSI